MPCASRTSAKYWSARTATNSSPSCSMIHATSVGPRSHEGTPTAMNSGLVPSKLSAAFALIRARISFRSVCEICVETGSEPAMMVVWLR